MKIVSATIREEILETWYREKLSERQLAERFRLTQYIVHEILVDAERARPPVRLQALTLARELYSAIPSEVAGPFAARFEQITGVRPGLLCIPVR